MLRQYIDSVIDNALVYFPKDINVIIYQYYNTKQNDQIYSRFKSIQIPEFYFSVNSKFLCDFMIHTEFSYDRSYSCSLILYKKSSVISNSLYSGIDNICSAEWPMTTKRIPMHKSWTNEMVQYAIEATESLQRNDLERAYLAFDILVDLLVGLSLDMAHKQEKN